VTMQAFFLEWMERLKKCITTNGEYPEYAQINVIEEWSFILPILRRSYPGGIRCKCYHPDSNHKTPKSHFSERYIFLRVSTDCLHVFPAFTCFSCHCKP
jgi:hypothetical protein